MKKPIVASLAVSLSIGALLLAGCAVVRPVEPTANSGVQGSVHGGQQPVAGATIQLYAVGTSGDGSAATPLFSPALVTDANGNFSTTSYTCPSASALVYLVATGGNPGLGSGQTNPQLALIAALGPCGNITSSTVAIINEVTTVAAAYALAPYTSGLSIGSGTSDAGALATAFGLAAEYVNVGTGLAPGTGVPTGYTVPIAQINTLGDILATCVNSAGGVVGDGSACGTFFQLTTPSAGTAPTDTTAAILRLANNPTLNTVPLYNMAAPTAPFQPTDIAVPPDFSVSLFASATMSLSPSSLSFANTYLTLSSTLTTTLTNNGPGPMTLSTINITGQNASDYSQTNNCPTTLAATASCTITVTFAPVSSGSRYGTLAVSSSATNSPVSAQLFGYALSPTMSVSPTSLAFPATTIGTAATAMPVVITNSGGGSVALAGFSFGGPNYADASQTNNCPATLAMGASCTAMVSVTPSIAGAEGGIMSVNSTNATPVTVTLSWSGVAAPMTGPLVASTPSLFVGYLATASLNLTNTGSAPIAISSIAVTGFQATESDTCGTSLAAGASCLVSIKSLDNYANPIDTGTLVVNNNSSTPQLTVMLSTSTAQVLTFPAVAVGGNSSWTITSGYGSFVSISGTISGLDASDFGGYGQGYSCFTRNGSCSVTLPFTPSATGSRVAFYTAGYALTGFGLAAGVSTGTLIATPTSLTFPQTALNVNSAAQTMTISNPQGHLLNFSSSTVDFQVSPAYCTAVSCPVSVIFNPKSVQPYQNGGALAIFDSATNQTVSFALSGIGGIPTLAFTPSQLSFGSITVGQSSASQTVSVSDTGDSPAYLSFSFPAGGTGSGDFTASSFTQTVTAGTPYTTYPYQFKPTNVGARSGTVTVTDSRTGLVVGSYNVTGTGIGALTTTLSAAPMSISFPNTVIGVTSAPLTVTVTNSGNFAATISSVSFGGANAGDFATSSSCATIAAQGTCTISVTFTPAVTGLRSGTLLIASNDPASPLTVPLSGTGSPIPTVTLNPSSLTFYERGAPQTVTMTNLSANPVTITSFNMVGHYTQTNNCGTVLAGNSSCAIQVSADSTVGVFTGSMTVVDSDTVDTQVVTLSSNVAYGTVLDFGSTAVGTLGSTRSLTGGVVTQFPGQISLIYSFALTGPNPTEFDGPGSSTGCGNHSGTPCSVYFVFQPQAVGVRYSIATANDGSIYLFKGTGLSSAQTFTVSPSSLNFGSTVLGSSFSSQVYLTNTSANGITPFVSASLATGPTNNGDYSITNNTCYGTVYGCSVTVKFAPQATGTRSSVLTFTSGTGYQQTVSLTGTGAPAPMVATLTASPTSATFGTTNVGTAAAAQTVTISNTGTGPATISLIGFGGTNPSDFTDTTTCGSTLAAGASCGVTVTFTPAATGTRNGILVIGSNATNSSMNIALTGTGISPNAVLSASPGSLTFGSTLVGTATAAQTVTISNTGASTATLSSIGFGGGNPGDFSETTTCGSSLASGASCTVSVTFSPGAAGTRSATLAIASNDPASPLAVPLNGSGFGSGMTLTPSPASVIFGSQAVGSGYTSQIVTLTNNLSTSTTIGSFSFTGANTADFLYSQNCGTSLAVGAQCSVTIIFSPGAVGSRSANLVIVNGGPNSPLTIPLSGTGTTAVPGSLTINTNLIGFGDVTLGTAWSFLQDGVTTQYLPISVSNHNASNVSVDQIAFSGANSADFYQSNNCPAVLTGGNSCEVFVGFTAGGTGNRTATLSVTSNSSGSVSTVPVTGAGVSSSGGTLTASVSSIAFGSTAVTATSAPQTLTLTNNSSFAVTIWSEQFKGANYFDFNLVNFPCGTIAANSSCSVNLTFAPIGAGARSAYLELDSNASNTPLLIQLSGTGTGSGYTASPTLIFSGSYTNAAYAWPLTTVGSSSFQQVATLLNNGSTGITLGAIAIAGGNPGDFTQTNNCPAVLPAYTQCFLHLGFKPTGTGARTGYIQVAGSGGASATLILYGVGN